MANNAKKPITFAHFAKHRFDKKKPFCCTPIFLKNCVFELASLKENTDVEQKTNFKSGKKNKDKERDFERKKKRGNQQK